MLATNLQKSAFVWYEHLFRGSFGMGCAVSSKLALVIAPALVLVHVKGSGLKRMWVEGCGWRVVGGGLWVEGCGWRVVDGAYIHTTAFSRSFFVTPEKSNDFIVGRDASV